MKGLTRTLTSQVEYHGDNDGERNDLRKSTSKLATDIFVSTKRTIFTPASKDLATPTFYQSGMEDTTVSSGYNSETSKKYNDREHHLASENEAKPSPVLSHTTKSSHPGPVSNLIESKRKILKAANKSGGDTSPSVKGMIEFYNKRITERQSLLTSPSKYWTSDGMNSSNISGTSSAESTLRHNVSLIPNESYMYPNQASPDLLRGVVQRTSCSPTDRNEQNSAGASIGYGLDSSYETSTDESEFSKGRAFKLKQAKEEFFSRNSSSIPTTRHSVYDDESKKIKTSVAGSSSQLISKATDTRDKPPIKSYIKLTNAKSTKSTKDSSSLGAVKKSASSQDMDQRGPLPIRPSSTDPALHSKSPKRILKLFKRSKDKHRREMGAVQQLCRLSMEVDIEKLQEKGHTRSSSLSATSSTSTVRPLTAGSVVKEVNFDLESQSRNTLPRPGSTGSSSTRSCPSSPVAPNKSKPSTWLSRGKELLKGRSPSPNIFKPS